MTGCPPDLQSALLQEKGPSSVSSPLLSQALESLAHAVETKDDTAQDNKLPGKGRGRGSGRGRKPNTAGRGKRAAQDSAPPLVGITDPSMRSPGDQGEALKLTAGEPVAMWSGGVMELQGMEGLAGQAKGISAPDLSLLAQGSSPLSQPPPTSQQFSPMTKRIAAKDMRKTLEFVKPHDPPLFDPNMDLTDLFVNLLGILRDKMKSSHDTISRIQGVGAEDGVQYQPRASGASVRLCLWVGVGVCVVGCMRLCVYVCMRVCVGRERVSIYVCAHAYMCVVCVVDAENYSTSCVCTYVIICHTYHTEQSVLGMACVWMYLCCKCWVDELVGVYV